MEPSLPPQNMWCSARSMVTAMMLTSKSTDSSSSPEETSHSWGRGRGQGSESGVERSGPAGRLWMPQEPQTGAVTTGGSGVEGPASHAGTPRHHRLQLLSAPRPPPGQPWTAPTRDEDLRTPSNPPSLGQELPGAVAKWDFPSRHRPGLPVPRPPPPDVLEAAGSGGLRAVWSHQPAGGDDALVPMGQEPASRRAQLTDPLRGSG